MKHDYVRAESLIGRNEVSIYWFSSSRNEITRVLRIQKPVETISLLNEQFVRQMASESKSSQNDVTIAWAALQTWMVLRTYWESKVVELISVLNEQCME